jgi:hypothetical protein
VRFQLGRTVATPAALAALEESRESPSSFLDRHLDGDWGEVDDHDRKANEDALSSGARILSVYRTAKGVKLYVLTDGDDEDGVRRATTIMLPEDY